MPPASMARAGGPIHRPAATGERPSTELQVLRDQEHHPAEADQTDEQDRQGGGEGPIGEEPDVQQRLLQAKLTTDERDRRAAAEQDGG
ncbi:hypothetical protein ABT001_10285 [Streptomyces sp. NPDC002793]|uniref:hypothetical protein n=1 Tax=Streptomyces sp. NPDC002793 TaxID=3154432 RepID=UPI003317E89A